MGGFKNGADRGQMTLLPERLDDYVGAENEVRVIDAFVDGLTSLRWDSRARYPRGWVRRHTIRAMS